MLDLVAHLEGLEHEIVRFEIRPEAEAHPLLCDVFDKTSNALIEAKGSVARPSIRMAIGQLADYARFMSSEPISAVLLPERPRQDLEELLSSEGIAVIWQDEGRWHDSLGGELVGVDQKWSHGAKASARLTTRTSETEKRAMEEGSGNTPPLRDVKLSYTRFPKGRDGEADLRLPHRTV